MSEIIYHTIQKRDYKKLYGKTQVQIYITMIGKGFSEKEIQKIYKIPQASLRRCRFTLKQEIFRIVQ